MEKPAATRFLHGPSTEFEIEYEIKSLLSSSNSIRIAVAYWGKGAVKRLGLESLGGRDIVVVCDLMSGACNPEEIRKLREVLGEDRVLTLDGLHAKVWITEGGVVVGSSNASANGLGFEGDEVSGLIEGNLLSADDTVIADTKKWFEKTVLKKARLIRDDDFLKATSRWLPHRIAREISEESRAKYPTLLKAIKGNPSVFEDRRIMVWVYTQGYHSNWANEVIEAEGKARHISSIEGWEDVEEGSVLEPGTIVLEFDFGKRSRRARFDGIWEVLKDDPLIRDGKRNVLLCRKLKSVFGFPPGDRQIWERAATDAVMNSGGREEWTLEGFAKEFL